MFTYNVTFHICTSHSNYIHRDTSFRKSVVTPISCDFLNVVGWWKEERFNLIHLHRTDLQLYEHIHLFSCVNILHWQIKQRTSIIIQTDRYASSIIQLCVENKLLLIHIGGKEHKQLHTCLSIHLYRIYNISLYIYIYTSLYFTKSFHAWFNMGGLHEHGHESCDSCLNSFHFLFFLKGPYRKLQASAFNGN